MIEEGLQKLVQGTPAVAAIATAGGGWGFGQIPKGQALPTWTMQTVSDPAGYLLSGKDLSFKRIQIDCYGNTAAEVMRLDRAIDTVLNLFAGTLADADATKVERCFRSERIDFQLDEASRTYRRMLEFEVWAAE